MPADRHQPVKRHSHCNESSPGSDIKTSGHRASRSLSERVLKGASAIFQALDYSTPRKQKKTAVMTSPMNVDDDSDTVKSESSVFLPLSSPPLYVAQCLDMIARQCQLVRDATAMKNCTPPRPRRPPTPISPFQSLPHQYFDTVPLQQSQPQHHHARDSFLPSPISYHHSPPRAPPQPVNTYSTTMDIDEAMSQRRTPTRRPRPVSLPAYSTSRRDSLAAAAVRFAPDIELIRDDAQTPDALRPESQLHYFHEVLPHVCAAFAPGPPANADVSPRHLLALYPPATGAHEQLAFTHIIRILYADAAVGLMPGEGWVERFEQGGRCLDVLKLVVPRDDDDPESTDGDQASGEDEDRTDKPSGPQQTTLTRNQLHLARDFLSLAKPCDEKYQTRPEDGPFGLDGSFKGSSSNAAYDSIPDISHTLICAPLDVTSWASSNQEMDVFGDVPAASSESSESLYVGEPTDQQRRNVLSILAVYLSFASRHLVQSVWSMVMFHLKGEYHGLVSAAMRRGPKALRDDRDTIRLWMGHGVASATGRRADTLPAKDRVLGVEAMWPGWEVLKDAVAMDY